MRIVLIWRRKRFPNEHHWEKKSAVVCAALCVLEERSKKDELLLYALREGEVSGFDENFEPEEFKRILHKVD